MFLIVAEVTTHDISYIRKAYLNSREDQFIVFLQFCQDSPCEVHYAVRNDSEMSLRPESRIEM